MLSKKFILWDLDGTLYRYGEDTTPTCSDAAAATALNHGATETREALFRHFSQAKNPHHYPPSLRDQLFSILNYHIQYHNQINLSKAVTPYDGLTEAFHEAQANHALLTHGSRPWAYKVLDFLGLRAFFPDDNILCLEDVDFAGKDSSSAMFHTIAQRLGIELNGVPFLEDSSRNLIFAHQHGMETHLISDSPSTNPSLPHVAHQHLDPIAALRFIKRKAL